MSYKYNPLLVGKLDQVGAGASRLGELDDVNTSGTVNGKVITFQSGTWIPQTPAGGGDMLKSEYVTGAGTVYNASRLEGDILATVQTHNVEAAKITSGTFGIARIPTMDDAHIPDVDGLSYSGAFATAQIPGMGAYKISAGTLAVARHESLNNLNGTVDLVQVPTMDDGHIPDVEGLSYGGAFAAAQIPNLAASDITTGTFGIARIPTIDDAHIPDLETLSYGGAFAAAQIPNLAASKVTTGTFNANRIPALPTARITTGTFNLNRIPTVDDARIPDLETLSYGAAFATGQIPNLPTTKITSGTFGIARIPSITNAYLAGEITSDKIPALSGTAVAYPLNADSVGTTAIKSGGVGDAELAASGLDIAKFTVGTVGAARIPSLPTSRITTGTFNLNRIPAVDDARIPNLETLSYGAAFATAQIPSIGAYKVTSGTLGAARIPALPTSRITTGTFGLARIPTIDDARIPNLEGLSYGGAFATAQIPGMGAYKISAGTLAVARHETLNNLNGTVALSQVPTMDDAHVPDLETLSYGAAFAEGQIPSLPTTKITSGTFNANRIPILPTARYGSAVLVSGTRSLTGDLDFAKHQAKAIALEALGSAPAAPATAQVYYNTGDDKIYVYIA